VPGVNLVALERGTILAADAGPLEAWQNRSYSPSAESSVATGGSAVSTCSARPPARQFDRKRSFCQMRNADVLLLLRLSVRKLRSGTRTTSRTCVSVGGMYRRTDKTTWSAELLRPWSRVLASSNKRYVASADPLFAGSAVTTGAPRGRDRGGSHEAPRV
jgi:hypothetical protein